MNKPIRLWALVIIVLISLQPDRANANSVAGGELIYEWITDSTYRFYFKIYNDCAGNPEPSSVTMCVRNTCNSTFFTRTLPKYTTPPPSPPPPVPYTCPQYKNQCDSPASTIPGTRVWWYTDTCTLPSRCSNWVFSVSLGNRVAGNTIANATNTEMYVEATLNNTGNYQGNSSPYFSVNPLSLACLNEPHSYNDGAMDPNNDSVVEVINPLSSGGACPAAPVNATFAAASPPLSVPANPFPSNNTFSMNGYTGAYAFTPVASGANTLVTRISEYRNGVKIGSIMRERSFYAFACPPQVPGGNVTFSCYSGALGYGLPGPFMNIEACSGQFFSFCYSVKDGNTAAKLVLTDNHGAISPGISVSYANTYTDSVTGTFSWTPSAIDTGLKILIVTVLDTVCKYPGVFTKQTFTVPIYIWAPTRALADTINICPGDTASLAVIGGGLYQWSVLSGTPGSLSCTNCSTPYATPAVTSQYVVTSTINPFCGAIFDTVTVNVLPNTYPDVNINVSPDTNVWPGLNVTFTATATNCTNSTYQWQRNGTDIPGANNAAWSSTTLTDMDVITCKLMCSDACPMPADTVSNAITMHVATDIKEAKGAQAIHVFPNPNTGRFTIAGTTFIGLEEFGIEIRNSIGQIVHREKLSKPAEASGIVLQVPGLAPGVYSLFVEANDSLVHTKFTVIK